MDVRRFGAVLCALCLCASVVNLAAQLTRATADQDFTGKVVFTAVISPAQITAGQNDYAPTGLATASVVRLSSDASRDLTGLTAQAGGRVLVLANVGAQPIVLKDESSSSTAANRFALSSDYTLAADTAAWLLYDGTSSRWRLLTTTAASVSGSIAASGVFNTPAGSIAATNVQTALNELDTEKAPLASPALTGTPTAPTASAGTDTTQIATTSFVRTAVDSATQALDLKASVRAISTSNITLSGAQTIDGVSVVAGDRVLVAGQSTASQNGIYVAAAGAWTRAGDADTSADVTSGMFAFVSEGTANGSNGYVLTTPEPIVLGTTGLTFTQFSGAGQIVAGTGLAKSGNTLSISGSYVGQSSITTVGALNSGSITSGFGSIDIGTDSLTAGAGSFTTLAASGQATFTAASNAIIVNNSGGDSRMVFQDNGVGRLIFGISSTTNGIVTGSVDGSPVFRWNTGSALFSADDGSTAHLAISSTGLLVTGTGTFTGKLASTVGVGLNALQIEAGARFHLDGGGNTWIEETSADVVSLIVGGAVRTSVNTTGTNMLRLGVGTTSVADSNVGAYLTPTFSGTSSQYGYLEASVFAAGQNSQAFRGMVIGAGTVSRSTYTGLNYRALNISTPALTGTGTIAGSYQIYIEAAPAGTGTYGIYQEGSDANYFGGEVQSTRFRASGGANDGRFDASFTSSVSGLSLTSSDNATDAYFAVFRKSDNTPIGTIRRVGTTDAVAYNTTSDGDLKENYRSITALQSGAFFDRARPWVYDWKSGAKDSTGYVAQELYADLLSVGLPTWGVTPGTAGKSHWQVDYSKVPDPITAAEIKSLRARVRALERN